MDGKLVALCICLLALSCARDSLQAKRGADSDGLEALKELCADPNGGHLSEELVLANYAKFIQVFGDSHELNRLISAELEQFQAEAGELKKGKRKNAAQIERLLESNTTKMCLMLDAVAELASANE